MYGLVVERSLDLDQIHVFQTTALGGDLLFRLIRFLSTATLFNRQPRHFPRPSPIPYFRHFSLPATSPSKQSRILAPSPPQSVSINTQHPGTADRPTPLQHFHRSHSREPVSPMVRCLTADSSSALAIGGFFGLCCGLCRSTEFWGCSGEGSVESDGGAGRGSED